MENPSTSSSSNGSLIERKRGTMVMMKIENPFTLKVGQVFTGFGIGCGLGIGVGRPLNLGAIPMLNQVMSAASGATHAFSGIGRHVNSSLKKIGAKNVEAGIGCGVGFGHGFGVGLAVKPGVVNQIQSYLLDAMGKMMMKFGVVPNLSIGQGILPASMQSGMGLTNKPGLGTPMESISKLQKKVSSITAQGPPGDRNVNSASVVQGTPLNLSYGTRTEKLINSFLQSPHLREQNTELDGKDVRLQSENRILKMVLKHEQIIEELMQENERLRQILVEDLKIPTTKLQSSSSRYSGTTTTTTTCSDCFECRRKHRRRR